MSGDCGHGWGYHSNGPSGPCDKCEEEAKKARGETWLVVKEHVIDHGQGERPTLGYLWPAEYPSFPSYEEALAFLKPLNLPLGWVVMNATGRRAI